MKKCCTCKVYKDESCFYKQTVRKDGLDPRCKLCTYLKKKESNQKLKETNPLEYAGRWRKYRKTYKENNPETYRRSQLKQALKKKFGITIPEYENMLKTQNYCCAICGIHEDDHRTRLVVDHCHKTGKVRELLCSNCNTGIGLLKEDIRNLEKSITYLEKHAV